MLPDGAPIPSDTLIYLERYGCYGYCPVYSLTIHADGSVIYQGEKDVQTIGEVRGAISEAELRRLVNTFGEARFFSLQDDYVGPNDEDCKQFAYDLPGLYIALTFNGTTKQIHHNLGCWGFRGEAELTALEELIDEVVDAEQWVK